MSIYTCPTCGELVIQISGPPHRCQPAWLVYVKEYGYQPEDADRVHATTAVRAAEQWSERHHAQYDYFNAIEVMVKPEAHENAPWVAYDIEVVARPEFTAREQRVKVAV